MREAVMALQERVHVKTFVLAWLILGPAIVLTQRAGSSGTAAQGATPSSVAFWTATEAFAKGSLILDRMDTNQYSVYAVRRDQPGSVELHNLDSDIICILEGSATFV